MSKKTSPNFFSSFDYVRTAWKHFRSSRDRLYILVLSEGPSIIGIATWEGDRPRLLAGENEEMCWKEIQEQRKIEKRHIGILSPHAGKA